MALLLVVDDDDDLTDVFSEVLRTDGYEVRTARNGEEALVLLSADPPDLIVCDVEMPVLDGPGMAYRILIRNAGLEKIPILLTSGVADLHRVAAAIGTPYFLSKPFSMGQLRTALGRALHEKAPPRPERHTEGPVGIANKIRLAH